MAAVAGEVLDCNPATFYTLRMNQSERTDAILNILLAAVAADRTVDDAEIHELERILHTLGITPERGLHSRAMEFAALDESAFNHRVNEAATLLKALLHEDEQRALLLNIMEIIDADRILHSSEVTFVGHIMRLWDMEQ
jgi:uncharacterized tellurite resistance protein B-like protein